MSTIAEIKNDIPIKLNKNVHIIPAYINISPLNGKKNILRPINNTIKLAATHPIDIIIILSIISKIIYTVSLDLILTDVSSFFFSFNKGIMNFVMNVIWSTNGINVYIIFLI